VRANHDSSWPLGRTERSYSPANHSGTKNYRLVSPGVNGARYMEIIYCDIERQPEQSHMRIPIWSKRLT
jgi:hypothetical protein